MNTALVLSADRLSKQVSSPEGTLTILQEVTLQVQQGESVAIMGASGAGKSTLLALLAGLDVPTSGQVSIKGIQLAELDEDGRAAVRAQYVGFVFQSFHLVPSLTALENVMLPLELAGKTDVRNTARQALERVGLGLRSQHYPNQLSGGEQQRVAIARAFVNQPALLFADEPTGNLDAATGERIIDLLFEMNLCYLEQNDCIEIERYLINNFKIGSGKLKQNFKVIAQIEMAKIFENKYNEISPQFLSYYLFYYLLSIDAWKSFFWSFPSLSLESLTPTPGPELNKLFRYDLYNMFDSLIVYTGSDPIFEFYFIIFMTTYKIKKDYKSI